MRSGFTLIELVVVVIILGILASVGIPQYRRALERARGAEAFVGLSNLQQAEKIYFVTSERYYKALDFKNDPDGRILDISLPEEGWDFKVEVPTPITFLVTAIRKSGPCAVPGKNKMTVDHQGKLDASEWMTCVDSL